MWLKNIQIDKIPHAIIVEGDSFTDKLGFAKEIVKAIVGQGLNGQKVDDDNYEDMLIVDRGTSSIKKEDVSEIQRFLKRTASLDSGNICIICNADNMRVQSQNMLLKTLEEPPQGSHIFLLSENSNNLLDTVRSRCVIYRAYGEDDSKVGTLELAESVCQLLLEDAYFHKAKKLLEKEIKDKEELLELLDGMEKVYREYLLGSEKGRLYRKEDIFKYIRYIEDAKKNIRYNVNYRTAFKKLIIQIGG